MVFRCWRKAQLFPQPYSSHQEQGDPCLIFTFLHINCLELSLVGKFLSCTSLWSSLVNFRNITFGIKSLNLYVSARMCAFSHVRRWLSGLNLNHFVAADKTVIALIYSKRAPNSREIHSYSCPARLPTVVCLHSRRTYAHHAMRRLHFDPPLFPWDRTRDDRTSTVTRRPHEEFQKFSWLSHQRSAKPKDYNQKSVLKRLFLGFIKLVLV